MLSCSSDGEPVSLPFSDDAVSHQSSTTLRHHVQDEVRYYLDRHDSRDEGYERVMSYATRGDSSLSAFLPQGPVTLTSLLRHPQGKQLRRDAQGRLVVAIFRDGIATTGLRIDSAEVFAGSFNQWGEATGSGISHGADGSYYEGQWEHDQREGFGLCIGPAHLQVGQWLRGRFRGEHMVFHGDHIYGIDISRYQHEKGRRRFPVSWADNHLTHLGRRISTEQVLDQLDYPVRFVYIKSTEGVTIKNRYYDDDDAAVRHKRLPVGAYHFLSTRTSPEEQALHFLSNTRFRRGDLPPMLDVEPSDKQIEEMGGPLVLFESMRTWLRIVEESTRTRPILYFNQGFAYNYLPLAPDIQRGYRFWVARYSEYKPDMHHEIWQLSGDGRVSGFHTEVDLNVFNGYQAQWDEFLRTATIP